MPASTGQSAGNRALALSTISFGVCFAAWGLIGGLAPVFTELYGLSASQTALLVAVPVLLGSLARLPMGMLTDTYGGRAMFTLLLVVSSAAAWLVPETTGYRSPLAAAFFIGLPALHSPSARHSCRAGPRRSNRALPRLVWARLLGQSAAVFGGPYFASLAGWQNVFRRDVFATGVELRTT